MTIRELNEAVRALVPDNVSTCVDLNVWHFGHCKNNPEVKAKIWVAGLNGQQGMSIEAGTAEAALELFKLQALPALGLSPSAPASERLAALDVEA